MWRWRCICLQGTAYSDCLQNPFLTGLWTAKCVCPEVWIAVSLGQLRRESGVQSFHSYIISQVYQKTTRSLIPTVNKVFTLSHWLPQEQRDWNLIWNQRLSRRVHIDQIRPLPFLMHTQGHRERQQLCCLWWPILNKENDQIGSFGALMFLDFVTVLILTPRHNPTLFYWNAMCTTKSVNSGPLTNTINRSKVVVSIIQAITKANSTWICIWGWGRRRRHRRWWRRR